MWESPSSESSIYRSIQFSLTINNMLRLIKAGFNPAEMTVREIYDAMQNLFDISGKASIMDAARIKQVATNNSLLSD